MGRPDIYRESIFADYPINLGDQGCRREILQAISKTLNYMWTACHQRLFICHFTVNIPADFELEANDFISSALQSWRRTMLNRKIKTEYLWAREKGDRASNGHPHYHIFVVVQGKYIQSAYEISKHLCSLIVPKLGGAATSVHCNSPHQDSYRWGKKVSAKLDNFQDAILWLSYLAKVETKAAPHGQKTFGFSKGYLYRQNIVALSPQEERQEEVEFDLADPMMSEEEWMAWGGSHLNWEEILDFDPLTGGSKKPVEVSSVALA